MDISSFIWGNSNLNVREFFSISRLFLPPFPVFFHLGLGRRSLCSCLSPFGKHLCCSPEKWQKKTCFSLAKGCETNFGCTPWPSKAQTIALWVAADPTWIRVFFNSLIMKIQTKFTAHSRNCAWIASPRARKLSTCITKLCIVSNQWCIASIRSNISCAKAFSSTTFQSSKLAIRTVGWTVAACDKCRHAEADKQPTWGWRPRLCTFLCLLWHHIQNLQPCTDFAEFSE